MSIQKSQRKKWNKKLIIQDQSHSHSYHMADFSSFKKFSSDNQFLNEEEFMRPLQMLLECSKQKLAQLQKNGGLSLNKIKNQNQFQTNEMKKNSAFMAFSGIFKNQTGITDSYINQSAPEKSLITKTLKKLNKISQQLKNVSFKMHRLFEDTSKMIKVYFKDIVHGMKIAMTQYLKYQVMKIKKTMGQDTHGSRLKIKRRLMSKNSLSQYSDHQDSVLSFGGGNISKLIQVNQSPTGSRTIQSPQSPLKKLQKYMKPEEQIIDEHHQQNEKDLSDLQNSDEQHTQKKTNKFDIFRSGQIIRKSFRGLDTQ